MSERYQIFDQESQVDSQQLATFLAKDGQLLLRWLIQTSSSFLLMTF